MNHEILHKPQLSLAMEECAELIQAISKFLRYGETPETISNLTEEIADVLIMIEQVKIITEITDSDIDYIVKRKLNRLDIKLKPPINPEYEPLLNKFIGRKKG